MTVDTPLQRIAFLNMVKPITYPKSTALVRSVCDIWLSCIIQLQLLFSWSPDPRERHTVWGLTIGLSFFWMRSYGFSQACVQRISATKSLKQARL